MTLDPGLLSALNFDGELTRRETIRNKRRAIHHGPAAGSGTAARRIFALDLATLRTRAAIRLPVLTNNGAAQVARQLIAEAANAARPNLPG
jgi:hypothetical protein